MGPNVPSTQLDVGHWGRLDGQPVAAYMKPVPLHVGSLSGEMVRPDWALFSRRRREVVVTLENRSYLYRITGIAPRELLERENGTPVASLKGVLGSHLIAETADAVDLAVALVMFYGVPPSAIKAQA